MLSHTEEMIVEAYVDDNVHMVRAYAVHIVFEHVVDGIEPLHRNLFWTEVWWRTRAKGYTVELYSHHGPTWRVTRALSHMAS